MNDDPSDVLDFASVGVFEEGAPRPGAPGPYRYEPFRSRAHHELQQRLLRGDAVRCRLATPDGATLHFVVTGCPSDGVLEIAFAP